MHRNTEDLSRIFYQTLNIRSPEIKLNKPLYHLKPIPGKVSKLSLENEIRIYNPTSRIHLAAWSSTLVFHRIRQYAKNSSISIKKIQTYDKFTTIHLIPHPSHRSSHSWSHWIIQATQLQASSLLNHDNPFVQNFLSFFISGIPLPQKS